MTDYKIAKDIPIPESGNGSKYPFADLHIGDSFFAPVKQQALAQSARNFVKRNGGKFLCRAGSDSEVGAGTRCWRLETGKKKSRPKVAK